MKCLLDRVRIGGVLLVCLLFCSCSTPRTKTRDWVKEGQKVGTVQTTQKPWGTESLFKDLGGRLMRTEKHNHDGRLLAGGCIVQFDYEPSGEIARERHFNSSENLVCNPEGFAVCTWDYSPGTNGGRIVRQTYYNENEAPAPTRAGFAILERTESSPGHTETIVFLNASREPAPSKWLGVDGVVRVQYAYLQGVTPITCAAFFGSTGEVITRKQLSGLTSSAWSNSYTTYHYYYYY